ncbi:zinc finger and BTB domain-containing protein 26-like [Epinephelus moara]|uniref:zinc finger and BTB domain-containing protein 26-like n=1 Tax=Epinephelus moara TaxID=300413 RepID=UPI00214E1C49|nr:zinc finger and BTB domain-containing protein 26-like [Epinephelus moara]XP_049908475.1 zinc finger and BTB domain-containing protein 26-like [Epinephelus moara]XP_049908476.1 zinc finger and BTB domain-containing protein 26-like [Epinephelus moara]
MMSSSCDTLQFRFPSHGDSILSKMKTLREEHRFCDITLLLGDPQGATVQPPYFHGHRVVLAASSDFLRDQFLLHEGQAELSVGVVSSMEVGERLLLSCYTGLLEVPLRELVRYLTAASALQMSQVVEKCAQAISQYLSPSLAFLKLERHSTWPGFQNQEEKDAAKPSTSNQEVSTEDGGAVVFQSRVSQGGEVDVQGLREVRDDGRVVIAKIELSENVACCLDTLESEEGGDIRPVHTNKPSCQICHIKGAEVCELPPPTAVQDHLSSTTRGSFAQRKDWVDSTQNHDESAGEEQRKGEMFLLELQDYEKLMDSNLISLSAAHLPTSDCSGDELTEDTHSILVQRPYLCRRCDRVFQHLESYVGHLKEHRQYLCLVCGKGFSQRSSLTCHIRIHTGVKPFRCPLCHKTFSKKATLQDHLNLTTGDKPHKYRYCAVHFAHKPGLRRHLKDSHGKSLQDMLEEAVH